MQQHAPPTLERRLRSMRITVVLSAMIVAITCLPFAEADSKQASGRTTIRLVNITIPPDSPLRNSDRLTKPPRLYLELFENGTRIGISTEQQGWEPDFPQTDKNQWMIKNDPKTRYLVKVRDANWLEDDMAFDISGCKPADLHGVVRERGSASASPDRLSTVEFERVEATKTDAP